MCSDEKNRYLRLKREQVCDDLESGNIRQKKVYDTKSKAPVARLVDSILAFCYKHNLVAVGLKHDLERVANRWFIINYENGRFFFTFDFGHS